MTPADLREAQEALGLTNKEFAELLCCSVRLIQMMRDGSRAVSERTEKLITRELSRQGR